MKYKYFKYVFILTLIFSLSYCGDDEHKETVKTGEDPPNGTKTVSVKLKADVFRCMSLLSGSPSNPCNLVAHNDGRMEIKVTGTTTSWRQTNRYEQSTFPYPTYHSESTGTLRKGDNMIQTDGCVIFEVPEGEDYTVEVTYIEGDGSPSCSPSPPAGNCWRWSKVQSITEFALDLNICGNLAEYNISVWSSSPGQGLCTY